MLKRWIVFCSIMALSAVSAQGKSHDPVPVGDAGETGLVAWWKLDEGSGTRAADSSGHGNDGTLRNGPVWVKGILGSALRFDGVNDYVAINNLRYNRKGIPAVTVATWVRTTKGGDQIIASFGRDDYWHLVISGNVANDGEIGWLVTTDAGLAGVRSRVRIDDGRWRHVAAVFDNGTLTVYVDGEASGTETKGRSFGTGTTRFGFLGIGSRADRFDGNKGAAGYFTWDLDDVRIYDRALSRAEIEQLAFGGPSNDLSENATPVGEVENLPFDTRQATHDGAGVFIRSPNLWYLYTPSASGLVTVSLAGSQFDTMLAVYRGAEPNPGLDRVIGFNDDFEGDLTSQLEFDAVAGQPYLIEVGGFGQLTGEGLLTIALAGAAQPLFDLGDAPDSFNSYSTRMTAYPDEGHGAVPAWFPTVFDRPAGMPRGPLHRDPLAVAHLGLSVTLESEADRGPDEDSVNNIDPPNDLADQDGGDDGVILPLELPHGEYTTFEYIVSVIEPNQDLWVNVWFDWNRDGDWDDDGFTNPQMVVGDRIVSEWAVQNQFLYGLRVGTHRITTPAFLAWHPEKGPEKVWMRITLSEQPWKGGEHPGVRSNGGSGPADGYAIGETEDYLIMPEITCSLCQDLNNDGKIDFDDLIELMFMWLDTCLD